MRPGSKKALLGMSVGLGAAAVAVVLGLTGVLVRWEYNTWTWRVRAFARPGPTTDRIRLILLDQRSLDWGKAEMGLSWPWPREAYAPILDFCRRGGAKVIAFDVLYTEPSGWGVADDELFGAAIREAPAFAGAVFLGDESGEWTNWPAAVAPPATPFEGLTEWMAAERPAAVRAARAAFPIPEVATNATVLGNVSDQPDGDGVFRRASLFKVFAGQPVPSLGLEAYLAAVQASGAASEIRIEPGALHINNGWLPIDSEGRAILRYLGPSSVHKTFNAAAVIQSEIRLREQSEEAAPIDPAEFQDCYVFFGFSAPGLLDLRVTPISKVYPGTSIHATVLDNLLSSEFIEAVPRGVVWVGTLLMALLAGLLGGMSRRAYQSVVTFLICLPIPLLVGFLAYAAGYWFPVVEGTSAVALALVGTVVLNYATEGRQKAFIKQAFKHYLSPAYIDQLLDTPSKLQLGGERRELSIFFSDLQGFSSFSERLEPQALTSLLNSYLTDMTDILMEEGGTLDKYEGDAFIAFWNAPVDEPDHAVRVCRTALHCQKKLAEQHDAFEERYGAVLRMRIGINTGEVVVGNMGSRERFNYTMLGDAANLASRLEGANKAFGTFMMVSDATWSKTEGKFAGRELGRIRFVGRKTPVRVFEVVAESGGALPDCVRDFEQGLRLCEEGKWKEALAAFERYPDDPPSKKYADRCRELADGRMDSWDGVWNLSEK